MNAKPDFSCMSLGALGDGDRALIIDVVAIDPNTHAKFAARGLVPGVEVAVLRQGDPLLVAIDDARWAITRSDANSILVDTIQQKPKSLLSKFWRR
jgi:Fe2+ transport system protein FeoA